MNPAFDRTLSLLVEGDDKHSPPRSLTPKKPRRKSREEQHLLRKPNKEGRFDHEGYDELKKQNDDRRKASPFGKMFNPKSGQRVGTTNPDLPPKQPKKGSDENQERIVKGLTGNNDNSQNIGQKPETFFDRLRSALTNSKEKFKAGARKISAKIRRKK